MRRLLCMPLPQVMEAVERFNDPLLAAKHVVQEAFRTWLRYEVRTDDITIVIMFIEDFKEGAGDAVRAVASLELVFIHT